MLHLENKYLKTKKFTKDSWIALRPMSLTLALGSTTLGIIAAYKQGLLFTTESNMDILKIFLITIAGLLSQSGANLINDYFDGDFNYYRPSEVKVKFLGAKRTYFDIYIFLWGISCFAIAGIIGIFLIYVTNIQMLYIGLIGIIGAYAYTGEPFVYKKKGLGALFSFVLMGPLMVYGAYFPFRESFSWYPILIGLPVSLLIPALMISNEMRDISRDSKLSIGTLSVRLGYKKSKIIYEILIIGIFVLTILFVILKIYSLLSLIVFLTVPSAVKAHQNVKSFSKLGIPGTNSLHWKFTFLLIVSLLIN